MVQRLSVLAVLLENQILTWQLTITCHSSSREYKVFWQGQALHTMDGYTYICTYRCNSYPHKNKHNILKVKLEKHIQVTFVGYL